MVSTLAIKSMNFIQVFFISIYWVATGFLLYPLYFVFCSVYKSIAILQLCSFLCFLCTFYVSVFNLCVGNTLAGTSVYPGLVFGLKKNTESSCGMISNYWSINNSYMSKSCPYNARPLFTVPYKMRGIRGQTHVINKNMTDVNNGYKSQEKRVGEK